MAFVGTTTTFSIVFTDTAGAAADPTLIRFFLREAIDGAVLEWQHNASAATVTPTGMNPIVKDSTGTYHLVFVLRKAERHTGFWLGSGAVNQSSQTTVFVSHSDVPAIDNP